MKNYYDILGVSKKARPEDIKAAYRKLARKYHPDTNGDDEKAKEAFQEIQQAYEVLSNPHKRKTYDYYGHAAYKKSYYAQHKDDGYAWQDDADDEDMHCGACDHEHGDGGHCGACDGQGHGHSHTRKDGHCGACEEGYEEEEEDTGPPPNSIRIAVWLELEECLKETTKELIYTEQNCTVDEEAIKKGNIKDWKIKVTIPARSYEHKYYNLSQVMEESEPFYQYAAAHPSKYFIVIILYRDKPGFIRQDYHLYTDLEVSYTTLALGGEENITGIDGVFPVTIPPGTDIDTRIRIPNRGMVCPPTVGVRGDLYAVLRIKVPKELTPEQTELLRQLRAAGL